MCIQVGCIYGKAIPITISFVYYRSSGALGAEHVRGAERVLSGNILDRAQRGIFLKDGALPYVPLQFRCRNAHATSLKHTQARVHLCHAVINTVISQKNASIMEFTKYFKKKQISHRGVWLIWFIYLLLHYFRDNAHWSTAKTVSVPELDREANFHLLSPARCLKAA